MSIGIYNWYLLCLNCIYSVLMYVWRMRSSIIWLFDSCDCDLWCIAILLQYGILLGGICEVVVFPDILILIWYLSIHTLRSLKYRRDQFNFNHTLRCCFLYLIANDLKSYIQQIDLDKQCSIVWSRLFHPTQIPMVWYTFEGRNNAIGAWWRKRENIALKGAGQTEYEMEMDYGVVWKI